jgi:hypothetical protein
MEYRRMRNSKMNTNLRADKVCFWGGGEEVMVYYVVKGEVASVLNQALRHENIWGLDL